MRRFALPLALATMGAVALDAQPPRIRAGGEFQLSPALKGCATSVSAGAS